jgi:N-acetyl-anhydromuramyl-L-alanine amidase AmpD
LAGALSVLDGPRQASWHFFISKVGNVYQHVDTNNIAWTNGGFDANRLFWGIECEGVEGEPLTEPQFDALLGVVRWLWDTHQVGAFVRQETLWEHREMTQFGSAPTSCPSGRIPWERLISSLEDNMLTPEDEAKIKALAKGEAQFEVGQHRDHEKGFNEAQTDLIRQMIAGKVKEHADDDSKHGGGMGDHRHLHQHGEAG